MMSREAHCVTSASAKDAAKLLRSSEIHIYHVCIFSYCFSESRLSFSATYICNKLAAYSHLARLQSSEVFTASPHHQKSSLHHPIIISSTRCAHDGGGAKAPRKRVTGVKLKVTWPRPTIIPMSSPAKNIATSAGRLRNRTTRLDGPKRKTRACSGEERLCWRWVLFRQDAHQGVFRPR